MSDTTRYDYVPPHSVEAEESVLGAVLLDNVALDEVAEHVQVDDFYRSKHRHVFQAMLALKQRGEPIDPLTLSEQLRMNGTFHDVGGPTYLAELAARVPTAANVVHYAKIVRDRSLCRQLTTVGSEIAVQSRAEGATSEESIERAQHLLLGVVERQAFGRIEAVDLRAAAIARAEALCSREPGIIDGVGTGLQELDYLLGGFPLGEMTIVAGRPGMGKTAFADQVAMREITRGGDAAIFSLEMPHTQLVDRFLSQEARVNLWRLRHGELNTAEWGRVGDAARGFPADRLFMFDSGMSSAQINAECRRLRLRGHKLRIVIVDYMQLCREDTAGNPSREELVSNACATLLNGARDGGYALVAVAQLNRQCELRSDKRPMLSDLRESGRLEQDASNVVFLYRDEVYDKDTKDKGVVELIVSKQRNGPVGKVRCAWRGEYAQFADLEHPDR